MVSSLRDRKTKYEKYVGIQSTGMRDDNSSSLRIASSEVHRQHEGWQVTLWTATAGALKLGPRVAYNCFNNCCLFQTHQFLLFGGHDLRAQRPHTLGAHAPFPSPWSSHLVLSYFPKSSITTSFFILDT